MKYIEKKGVLPGAPWLDYKHGVKALPDIQFVFTIGRFHAFILREVCLHYACQALGFPQPNFRVSVSVKSQNNELTPVPMSPQIFSSPSEDFNLGALNGPPVLGRLRPLLWDVPCDFGETLIVKASSAAVGIDVGCLINGQRIGGDIWL